MWLAERVWEPTLPRALRDAGVEYVLVDDQHFALAGLPPDELGGYYLTEDQGATVGVFPINGRLRHLIPFAEVEKSIEYLGELHGRVSAVTVVDDGEKFGGWPGTFKHVYEDGWLDAFFDRVTETPWLKLGHVRRRRGRAAGLGSRLSADRVVPGDGRVGPAHRRGPRAGGGETRSRATRRRRAAGRPAAGRLLAELPRQVSRGGGDLLEDAPAVGGGHPGAPAASRRPGGGAGARGALARPGQRRVLARRVRRLLPPAPAPGGEERAAGGRGPAGGR